jgi:hypothetical protein
VLNSIQNFSSYSTLICITSGMKFSTIVLSLDISCYESKVMVNVILDSNLASDISVYKFENCDMYLSILSRSITDYRSVIYGFP